nr:MAG TPA: hypothetical protein [Caudoviricetes sp.]
MCTLWQRNDWIICAFRVINRLRKKAQEAGKHEDTEIWD